MNEQEIITYAAVNRSDGVIAIGRDHAEIIRKSPYGTCKAGSSTGFVTSTGRYVDRHEAAKIALAAGQLEKLRCHGTFGLFSEDINQNWEKDSFNDDEQYKDDFKIEFKE